MDIGIYEIINVVTGDSYIGQSAVLNYRRFQHFNDLRNGKHHEIYLQRAYNKYGKDSFLFNVLLYCEMFELDRYEQALVDRLNPAYNLRKICVVSNRGVHHTEEAKQKMSLAAIGHTRWLGKKHSEETKMKMRKPKSDGARQNMSISQKGKKISAEARQKMSIARKGRHIKNDAFEINRMLREGFSIEEIMKELHVGKKFIINVKNGLYEY
jgi:group I intron endonuclease